MNVTAVNTGLDQEADVKQIRNYELPRPKRQYQLGLNLMKKNRLDEALDRFREAVTLDHEIAVDILIQLYKRLLISYDQTDFRLMAAQIYCDIALFKEALSELEDIFETAPNNSKLYQILGKLYAAGGNKVRIMELFEHAIDKGVTDTMVIDMLSRIYLDENHIQKSEALYAYLVEIEPENPNHLKILAELHVRQRHYDDALATYSSLYERFPYVANELYEPLRQLCRQAPRIPKIREIMSLICLKICQPLEAVYHLQEMVRYNHSQLPTAVPLLKKALDQYPGTFEIAFALAENLIRLEEYSESVEYLTMIFNDIPEQTDVLLPVVESILDRLPDQYSALCLGADIYMRRKEHQKALHFYERIIALKPAELGHVEQGLKTFMTFRNVLRISQLFYWQNCMLSLVVAMPHSVFVRLCGKVARHCRAHCFMPTFYSKTNGSTNAKQYWHMPSLLMLTIGMCMIGSSHFTTLNKIKKATPV